jgi:hypothetical protein
MASESIETRLPSQFVHQQRDTLDHPLPIARAVLVRGRYSWIWVVLACPYCGQPHDHYGGPLDRDPYRAAGQLFPARCARAARRQLLIHQPDAALWYVLGADPQPGDAPPACTRGIDDSY